MQKLNTLLFVIVAGLTFSCGEQEASTQPVAPTFEETLLGTWETIEIEAHCPTYLGQDTTVHQLIKEADWSRQYGAKPSRTAYTADGKLKRTYYNVRGEITDVTNGLWKTVGEDSLFVIEPNTTLSYKHELDGSRLTLTGKVDWDYDGEADDDYRAVLRLVSRTN